MSMERHSTQLKWMAPPETRAREDEASKILGKIIDILGYKEENMSDE